MSVHPKIFRYTFGRILLYTVLIATSILMIIPFYWTLSTSFKIEQNVFSNPPQWIPNPFTWANFDKVINSPTIHFFRYLGNSIFIASVVTLAHVFFDTLAGYAFGKLRFPGRDLIFFIMLMALMVPFQTNIIPIYKIMASFHMIDTYWALIIPNLTSIFGIFLMRQFMMSIPNDLLDAARIDGCSEFGVFRRVALPLALPGIATLVIFTFMGVWNDFLWPRLVLNSEKLFTLPVGLALLQMKNTSNQAQIMAGTVLTALPMIVVFLFMQRQFIEGMTAGALKE